MRGGGRVAVSEIQSRDPSGDLPVPAPRSRAVPRGVALAGQLRCTVTGGYDSARESTLDDGNGRIRPELVPLAELLTSMNNPLTGLSWISSRPGRSAPAADLLEGLGRGDIERSHDELHRLQPWRAAAHL